MVAIDQEMFCLTDSLQMLWHVRADTEANDLVSCNNLKVVSIFITSLQLISGDLGSGTVFVSCSCSDDKQDIEQSRKRNLVIALNGNRGNVLWRQQLDSSQEKLVSLYLFSNLYERTCNNSMLSICKVTMCWQTEDNTASWLKYTSDIISMLVRIIWQLN